MAGYKLVEEIRIRTKAEQLYQSMEEEFKKYPISNAHDHG